MGENAHHKDFLDPSQPPSGVGSKADYEAFLNAYCEDTDNASGYIDPSGTATSDIPGRPQ